MPLRTIVSSYLFVLAFVSLAGCGGDDSERTTPPGLGDGSVEGADATGDAATEGAADGTVTDTGADANDAGSGDGGDAGEAGNGNVLIADQFNNRVIEVDPTGKIVWTFGDGTSTAGAMSVVAPNDAERIPQTGQTLISGTGAPPNAEPTCTGDGGCPDNRVLLVDHTGAILWQYGVAGPPGSGADQLNTPVASVMLASGHVLITDQGNQRVIEVDNNKQIVWQYGTTGTAGTGPNQLSSPNGAERLTSGNTLIADEGNNRVLEVDMAQNTVWTYPATPDTTKLNAPAFASRLPNGNTLIADSNNNRVVEVTAQLAVAWSFVTNTRVGSNPNPLPTRAVRLAGGTTLIADQLNHQVIEVDHNGNIVWSYGALNMAGSTAGQLNAPYDAKRIGDFTGLTPPQ